MGKCFGKNSGSPSCEEVPFQSARLPSGVIWTDIDTDSDDDTIERYEIKELRSAIGDFISLPAYLP